MESPARINKVLGYATSASFPTTGTKGIWYFDLSTGTPYIWDGSAYQDLDPTADDIWQRILTTISPQNAGDDLALPGSGELLNIGTQTNLATPAVTIISKNSGYADPSAVGAVSDGDKWTFWNAAGVYKGAIGFAARTMWFQSTDVGAAANRFKWYGGSAGSPVELFSLGDDLMAINEGRQDIDFKIAKATSGYSYIYDYGVGSHTWIGSQVFNSDFADKDFTINKLTAGEAFKFDAGEIRIKISAFTQFQDPGTDADSYKLGFVCDTSSVSQHSGIQGIHGAIPTLRISVPHETGGAETSVIDIARTKISMITDNSVDLGATGAGRLKDIYVSGSLKSEVATGTAPLVVASTTLVSNLNADKVDGKDETEFALLAGRAGGQILIGGTGSGDDLTFQTTSDGTKGSYIFSELNTANGILQTDGSGVLSSSVDLPTSTTIGTAYVYRVGGTDIAVADGGTNSSTALGNNKVMISSSDAIVESSYLDVTGGDFIVKDGSSNNILNVDISEKEVILGDPADDGVLEISDSTPTVKIKWNSIGDSYIIGGNTIFSSDDGTTPSTLLEIETVSTEGDAGLTIDQNDDDEPFINYEGKSAADQANNISTVNGDGAVDGPKNYSSSAGWTFVGMVRINVNGTDYWTPYYSTDLS